MGKFLKFKFIFILCLFTTISIANFYYEKFGNKYVKISNYKYPALYQEDALSYFAISDKISEDVENGNNFFNSGSVYRFSFLYPRIIYLFNNFINDKEKIINKDNFEVKLKNGKFLIFFQIIIFYLSVLLLSSTLSKVINKNLTNLICLILLINPIINQWHISFYTESIYLSFLTLLISFLIKSKNFLDFLFIGIFIGIMYMQRTITLLYPLVIFIYIILLNEDLTRKLLKFICFISGLILILVSIGLHNYTRAGVFYFTPIQSKLDLQNYLEIDVIKISENLNYDNALKKINELNLNIIKSNNYDLSVETDRVEYSNKVHINSIKTLLKNKSITFKIIFKNYFHSMLLNPVQVYYESKYQNWKDYKNSADHNNWLIIRMIITPIFFVFAAVGFLFSIKKIDPKLNIFIFLSILYFFLIGCWLPNTRYFVPSNLFMSIYFSVFLHDMSLFLKNRTLLKKNLEDKI